MKTWIFRVVSVCLFACIASSAQSTDPAFVKERLDTVAKSYSANNAFMGTVLVVEGDRTLLEKSYGMADLEWSIPNAPDVKFRLCSVTKQFTAALVLLLQEDGKLNIADPIVKYLPDVPKHWEKITLAELLGHTSGIPDIINDKDFGTWSMSPHSPAEQLARIRDKPLEFEPGSRFAYSNSNYVLLGMVIEQAGGQKYGDLLRQRILLPLDMKDSGLDADELVLPRRAQGYNPGKNGLISARQSISMTVPWAAGSIYSTTGDMLRWERGLFGGKVLNEASLKAMTTPGQGGYGLGVEVAETDGLKVIKHDGGMPGFSARLTYVPERKIAVIVLSNVYGPATAAMGEQLLDVAMGKAVVLASERKPVPIAKSELGRFVGVYDVAPAFAIAISVGDDSLMAQGSNQTRPMPLIYQGIVEGHPRFYIPKRDAELEFVTDATGAVNSLVLHQGGEHPAKKR
jgi:CubicO group peptidase (beta-lactamase class C family)